MTACNNLLQLFTATGIKFLHLRENLPRILRVTSKIEDSLVNVGACLAQRLAMCVDPALKGIAFCIDCSESHYGMSDNQCRGLLLL